MDKKHLFSTLLVLYLIFISYSMFSNGDIVKEVGNYDKIIHFIIFFGFSVLLAFTLKYHGVERYILNTIFFGMIIGFFFEFGQYFISVRTFSRKDLLMNWFGILGGALVVKIVNLKNFMLKN